MKLYGGYRFTELQYTAFAKRFNPSWWAQMDYCCEPEIAANDSEIKSRIRKTVENLNELRRIASGEGVEPPMPVLQGWKPEDYAYGPIHDSQWPSLVGIGSVCRRQLNGPDGLFAVLDCVDSKLPPHVKLHLFGVKGTAIRPVLERFYHRIASFDSQAWAFGNRLQCLKLNIPCGSESRAAAAVQWHDNFTASTSSLQIKLI